MLNIQRERFDHSIQSINEDAEYSAGSLYIIYLILYYFKENQLKMCMALVDIWAISDHISLNYNYTMD